MFPTLVWKLRLKGELCQAIDAQILRALEHMRSALPPLAPGQGWQSQTRLHRREEFAALVACVNDAARSVLRFLHIACEDLEISGAWATVLAPGAQHRAHAHPNNFLSAVYYLRTHPGADTISFHDPRRQAAVIRPPVTRLTAQNTDQVVVEVANGTLLMFPSYLEHSVDPTRCAEERISISFNLMFAAFGENLSAPLW